MAKSLAIGRIYNQADVICLISAASFSRAAPPRSFTMKQASLRSSTASGPRTACETWIRISVQQCAERIRKTHGFMRASPQTHKEPRGVWQAVLKIVRNITDDVKDVVGLFDRFRIMEFVEVFQAFDQRNVLPAPIPAQDFGHGSAICDVIRSTKSLRQVRCGLSNALPSRWLRRGIRHGYELAPSCRHATRIVG
jgi:hypothetical protein